MANPNKFTSKEVLNKVLLDSSGNAVTANSVTTQEALNSVLDTTNNRLNMSLAGGTISGDVTIDGDLTVNGNGSGNYDEIVNGNFEVSGEIRLNDKDGDGTFGGRIRYDNSDNELRIESNEVSGDDIAIKAHDAIFFQDSGGTKMLLDAGKLTVGSDTSPTGILHIAPGSGSAPTMFFEQYTSATDGTLGEISFGNRAVDGQLALIQAKNDGANDSAFLAFHTEVTSGALTERMRIESGGDILIKTADAKIKADSTNTLNIQAHNLKILGSGGEERFHFQSEGNSNPSEFSMKGDTENTMIKLNTNGDSFIHGKSNSAVGLNITAFSTNEGKIPRLRLRHSNNNTVGTDTAVDDGDSLGEVAFQGYDGSSEYNTGASISAKAGATFTTSEARTTLIFKVASGSQNPEEKLRLSHDGILFVGGFSGLATPELAIKSNTTGNGLVNVVSFRDSNNTQQGYLGYGSSSHGNLNLLNLLGGLNFYAGSANIRFALDDNSRISLSNNDASGAVGTTLFGYQAALNLVSGAENGTYIGHMVAGNGTITNAADSNTAIGFKSMFDLTSGSANTAVGYRSAFDLTSGTGNTALGSDSLKGTDDGTNNVAIGKSAIEANCGDFNVAVGSEALLNNVGSRNIAVGYQALKALDNSGDGYSVGIGYKALAVANGTGIENVAIGGNAGLAMTTGHENVLIGSGAGATTTNSDESILIGYHAGQGADITVDGIIGIGYQALQVLTSGSGSTVVGYQAGKALTTGSNNTAVGYQALLGADDSQGNVAIGHLAMGVGNPANNNVAIGASALEDTTGASNVAIGYRAGRDVLGVNDNVLIGHNAGLSMTDTADTVLIGRDAGKTINHSDANGTVCVGKNAGELITEGQYSTLIGFNSGMAITTADGSTSLGYETLKALTTGVDNVAIGERALDEILTGCCNIAIGTNALGNCDGAENENIAIGNNAGLNLDGGSNNTIVGANANASVGNASGQIVLGKDVTGAGNNNATLGISTNKVSIDLDGSDTSWAASSDERLKENIQASTAGLSFINELRPVTFNWKKAKDVDKSMSQYQDSEEPALGAEGSYGKTMHGFIAQEVKSAIDKHSDLKEGFSMWKEWEDGTQAVSDGALVTMLVKAIQELSARVEELESK
jgi:hypothetical protein